MPTRARQRHGHRYRRLQRRRPDGRLRRERHRAELPLPEPGPGRFAEQASAVGRRLQRPAATTVSGMGSDAKDFDNDGRVDVFYNNLQKQIWGLFRNEGAGVSSTSRPRRASQPAPPFSGWSNGFIDYDNDGWKDIYSANGDVDYVGDERGAARHPAPQPRRQARSWTSPSGSGRTSAVGYQRGSAVRRLEQRRLPGYRRDLAERAAAHPAQLGHNGNHWLMVDTGGRRATGTASAARSSSPPRRAAPCTTT